IDGSATPPAEHAHATILQNGNHEMGLAPAHARPRPLLMVHLADQRQFPRCSNRAVSRERYALSLERRVLLLTRSVFLVLSDVPTVPLFYRLERHWDVRRVY